MAIAVASGRNVPRSLTEADHSVRSACWSAGVSVASEAGEMSVARNARTRAIGDRPKRFVAGVGMNFPSRDRRRHVIARLAADHLDRMREHVGERFQILTRSTLGAGQIDNE